MLRLIRLRHLPSHPEYFSSDWCLPVSALLDDWEEAPEKGWVFGKGWTSALRFNDCPVCEGGMHKIISIPEEKVSWRGRVDAEWLHVLQQQNQERRQCVPFNPGIPAESPKCPCPGHTDLSSGPYLGAPRNLSVHFRNRAQGLFSSGLLLLQTQALFCLKYLFIDLLPDAHLLNSQALVSRFPPSVRESSSNLHSRPMAWITSWAVCDNAVFRVKYLMGQSIDVNPFGVLLWNAYPIFSITLVVSRVSFACLIL